MKLTAKGRYAVMAVADMAVYQSQAGVVSLSAIAERQGISLAFLEQLFVKIRRAGLVASERGARGGYIMLADPSKLTLDKIIAAVDEDIRVHGCSPQTRTSCTGRSDKCLTHSLWGALEAHIVSFLAGITVQDVIDGRLP